MKTVKSLFVIALFLLASCNSGSLISDKINVEGGVIQGYTGQEVHIFKGVPFAAPPVGDLRWKAPQPVVAWEGVRQCTENPPSAMQQTPEPFFCWSVEFLAPKEPMSEDCLYLNVWTAASRSDEKRPVIVWIHGGGFSSGSGTVPLYDGTDMAKKGVVFVTINYRLGVFGLLAHPELSAESPDGVSGNYGILDQIEALKWVKKNISAFGGDPDNVTIAGQSAGSFSVNILMTAPLAKGLFQRAIGESGAMFGSRSMMSTRLKDAEKMGLAFAERAGAGSIAELRQKSAGDILATPGMSGITIDSLVVLPPGAVYASGDQSDVPLITGWNNDDAVSFGPPQKAADYISAAKRQYGEMADEYLKLFPAGDDEEAARSQKLISRMFFEWQNYAWAKAQDENGTASAWLYYFTHVPPGEPDYGAFHSSEFGYALHTLRLWDRPFTDYDHQLSDMMSSYWVNFAANGDPNGEGLPEWPAFMSSDPEVLLLGDEVKAIPLPDKAQLDFLDVINNR